MFSLQQQFHTHSQTKVPLDLGKWLWNPGGVYNLGELLWESSFAPRHLTHWLWSQLQTQKQFHTSKDLTTALFCFNSVISTIHPRDPWVITITWASGNRHTDLCSCYGPWSGQWNVSSSSQLWSRRPWRYAHKILCDYRSWEDPKPESQCTPCYSPWIFLLAQNPKWDTLVYTSRDPGRALNSCILLVTVFQKSWKSRVPVGKLLSTLLEILKVSDTWLWPPSHNP